MPVEHVEDRLTADGDFLLRNIRDTLHVVLSVFWDGKVWMRCERYAFLHCLFSFWIMHIEATGTWRWWRVMYSFDGKDEFVTVADLVAYHYANKVPLPKGIQLLRPIKTPNFKYTEEDINIIKKIGQGAFGEVYKVLTSFEI